MIWINFNLRTLAVHVYNGYVTALTHPHIPSWKFPEGKREFKPNVHNKICLQLATERDSQILLNND